MLAPLHEYCTYHYLGVSHVMATSTDLRLQPQRRSSASRRQLRRKCLWLGCGTGVLILFLFLLGVFNDMELSTLDARFFWRGEHPAQDDIVIVAVDEASFGDLNLRWPWPRQVHARLVDALHQSGAKLIVFDILFAEPSDIPGDDAIFAAAIERAGNVVLVNKVSRAEGRSHVSVQVSHPLEQLELAAARVGLANIEFDQDKFVRRSFLAAEYNAQMRPSLPLAVVAEYMGWDEHSVYQAIADRSQQVNLGPHQLRLADNGSFVINYAGGVGTYPTYSYYQVLAGMVPTEWLQGKIVMIGASEETLHDTFSTPFFNKGPTPGVEVHANAVATLLSGQPIIETPLWCSMLLIFSLAVIISLVLAGIGPWKGLAFVCGTVVLLLITSLQVFRIARLWLPLVPPLAAVLGCYVIVTAYRFVREEGERRRIRQLFGRYVSDDVVKEIVDSEEGVALGGKRQLVTILFSDIRGFTPMSERMQPEEVVSLLNEYFEAMTAVIFASGGTIDKYVGDCIMALWGAPLPAPDDAARAVRAAVLMRQALADLQEKHRAAGKEPFDTGVGINTAEVVVGNIGAQRRLDYTVIGDGVNLAARLESATKELGASIVISSETYQLVQEQVIARLLPLITVKGKEHPVQTYEVLGWREPDGSQLLVPGIDTHNETSA